MTVTKPTVYYIHLRADRDLNGNPRRIYLIIGAHGTAFALDEGHRGIDALEPYFPRDRFRRVAITTLDIPIHEYRRILRAFPAPELQV